MNITIHTTDEKLRELTDALKIKEKDYDLLNRGKPAPQYAKRIVMARNALGLSTQKSECVLRE